MTDDLPTAYLAGLPDSQRDALARANGAGLAALHGYLTSGEAVAFLGAGTSAPLYPLWGGLIGQLVEAAADRLNDDEAHTCRALAAQSPEEVVEILRQRLGVTGYREALREVLKVRTNPDSGRSWTPAQELVCRCRFRGVVTTNYDSGIVDARMRVRTGAAGTGFTTWQDELALDRWRTGEAFGDAELPVLFAHGLHSQPDSVVLAPPSTGAPTPASYRRSSARWWTAGAWSGSDSASQTSGSQRSCTRSGSGRAAGQTLAARLVMWRSCPGIRRPAAMSRGFWPAEPRLAMALLWCCTRPPAATTPPCWRCCPS